jgi:hypothetical protein
LGFGPRKPAWEKGWMAKMAKMAKTKTKTKLNIILYYLAIAR